MPTIDLTPISVTFDVNYPEINFSIDLVVPHEIPIVGGKHKHLSSFSLSLVEDQVTIPVFPDPFSGSITVGLDFVKCEISIDGYVELNLGFHKFHWKIGPARIPYAAPIRFPTFDWSETPVPTDSATLQAKVNASPDSHRAKFPPTPMDSSTASQALLRGLFTFFGTGTFIDEMQAAARHIASKHAVAKLRNSSQLLATDSNVILAFGFNIGGGIVLAPGMATGIYITSYGDDFGTFGTVQIGGGFVAELAMGGIFACYWPADSYSAKDNFSGENFVITIDGGEGVTGSLSLAWPAGNNEVPPVPCGLTLGLGGGVGLPVNFVASYSVTALNINPPPPVASS